MAKEFEKASVEDLRKMIAEKREALRVFRFEGEGSRRRNVREGRTIRREIARIMTEVSTRRVAETKKTK